jgi:hypothetical protein
VWLVNLDMEVVWRGMDECHRVVHRAWQLLLMSSMVQVKLVESHEVVSHWMMHRRGSGETPKMRLNLLGTDGKTTNLRFLTHCHDDEAGHEYDSKVSQPNKAHGITMNGYF